MSFLSNFFSGDQSPLDRYSKEIEEVNSYKTEIEALSQEQIKEEITKFKLEIAKFITEKEIFEELKKIAPRVFAQYWSISLRCSISRWICFGQW